MFRRCCCSYLLVYVHICTYMYTNHLKKKVICIFICFTLTPLFLSSEQKNDVFCFSCFFLYIWMRFSLLVGSQGLSLQQAFMRKKKGFIASAAGRREQAKAEMLAKVKVAAPKLEPAPSYSSLSQTLASWKKSRALNATNKADKGEC